MALDTTALKEAIKSAYTANLNNPNADQAALQAAKDQADILAGALASAIETFVKSGTVNFNAGQVTGGTPANGNLTAGAATGGTIS